MSFASDFGHDIPPDDWDGDYRRRSGGRKGKRYYSYVDKSYLFMLKSLDYDRVETETEMAYLIVLKSGVQHWLPKSQVSNMTDNKLYIPFWLYEKLDLNTPTHGNKNY